MIKKKVVKRVIVGMSGGVDSSVAAAVLKAQGYDVVGVFMHFWAESMGGKGKIGRENACCSLESLEDARKIAGKLGISLYTVNVSREFKKTVVDYFLKEYQAGRTPNPCIRCNREIKFQVLIKKMLELGADYIATGHYARVSEAKNHTNLRSNSKNYKLTSAKDQDKDQSYFLYALSQEQLKHILFPIGEFKNKDEVRRYAKKLELPIHTKKDSQDICFIPDSTGEFLKRNLKLESGNIIDDAGNILGRHDGLPLYTLGQRKGIKIGGSGPYFVANKNRTTNELLVANKRQSSIGLVVEQVNWIQKLVKLPKKVWIRTRYRNPLVHGIIKLADKSGRCLVFLDKPEQSITPGQSVVFYDAHGLVLGGGIIQS